MPYLSSLPVAVRDSYLPNETIDFLLDFNGMRILPDSVMVKGANPEVPPTNTELVYMDPVCGIDAVFQSITVSFND